MAASWGKRLAVGGAVAGALGVGVVLGLVLAPDDDKQPPPPTGPLPRIDLGAPGTYLAIGDSYSAGEGLPEYDPETDDLPAGDRCHRSPQYAFPMRLQPAFEPQMTIVHRACSGAQIKHVFDEIQTHGSTPNHLGLQIEPGDETGTPGTIKDDLRLVTITISGNDLHFADMLIFCAKHSSCLDDEFESGMTLSQLAEVRLDTIQSQLTDLYRRIREIAPAGTRILAVGYPGLFPDHAPSLLSDPFCHEVLKLWGEPERDAIRDWNVRLDVRIQTAADAAGIEYVDVYPYFGQHETCGSAGPWIKFVGDPSRAERDGWFHPTRAGQYMLARVTACYLHVYRSPDQFAEQEAADAAEMSNCVSNHYPGVSSSSLPTPCTQLEACRIEDEAR